MLEKKTFFTASADGPELFAEGEDHRNSMVRFANQLVTGGKAAEPETTDPKSVTVENRTGTALLQTGDSGTTLYTLSGAWLLMISALMYSITLKRRRCCTADGRILTGDLPESGLHSNRIRGGDFRQ